MEVHLIATTYAAQKTCGRAAAKCVGSSNPEKSLAAAMARGHEGVAEHANFTFEVNGVSRVLLAQLTRHRLMSFDVTSQRYIRVKDVNVVVPDSVIERGWADNFKAQARAAFSLYNVMAEDGVPIEDARYILPEGCTVDLIMTCNARELRHFFSLRCCNRAQWEIRQLADEMLRHVRRVAPVLFADAGPACVRGRCPEGSAACKQPRSKDPLFAGEVEACSP